MPEYAAVLISADDNDTSSITVRLEADSMVDALSSVHNRLWDFVKITCIEEN